MSETGLDNVRLLAQSDHCGDKPLLQFSLILATDILEFNSFQILSNAFVRIQFRGITQQSLHPKLCDDPLTHSAARSTVYRAGAQAMEEAYQINPDFIGMRYVHDPKLTQVFHLYEELDYMTNQR